MQKERLSGFGIPLDAISKRPGRDLMPAVSVGSDCGDDQSRTGNATHLADMACDSYLGPCAILPGDVDREVAAGTQTFDAAVGPLWWQGREQLNPIIMRLQEELRIHRGSG